MTTPGAVALVPDASRERFRRDPPAGITPVFYTVVTPGRRARVVRRIRRATRLPWSAPGAPIEVRIDIAAGADELREVNAFWMSDQLSFSRPAMNRMLDRLPELRWVYYQRSGVERLDLAEFRRRDVALSNTGDLVSRWVAEMVLACVLTHAKGLPEHIARQRIGRSSPILGAGLALQTVGIVGTGNIGAKLARMCRALDMRVVGVSRRPEQLAGASSPYHEVRRLPDDLEWLAERADHLTLAVPLTPETTRIIDARILGRMRPNASLINITRPQVVDETALLSTLHRRAIGAAYLERVVGLALRVYAMRYPDRLVITHGSAAHVAAKHDAAFDQFVAGVQALAAGDPPDNRVV